jgi:succinoglycan biosynthesis transport protein ExoP
MANTQEPHTPTYSSPTYSASLSEEGAEPGIDLAQLWNALLKKKHIVLMVIVAALAAAAAYLAITTPTYQATSLIELSIRRPRIMRIDDSNIDTGSRQPSSEHFNTELRKLKRPSMRQSVYEKVSPTIDSSDEKAANVLKDLVLNIELQLIRRSSIVEITAKSTDPEQAAELANAYANVAVENVLARNATISDNAVVWLQAQAETQRALLEKAENALLTFRKEHHVDALRAQQETAKEALLSYNQQLVLVETQSSMAKETLAVLKEIEAPDSPNTTLPSSLASSESLHAKFTRLAQLTATRDALLSRYTEKHPEILKQNLMIASTKTEIKNGATRLKQQASTDYTLLSKQAAAIRDQMSKQSEMGVTLGTEIAQAQTKLAALDREKDACEMSYKGILRRMEEARLSADEKTATVEIVEPAEVPLQPVHPNKLLVLALALMAGGGLGVFGALVINVLEDQVSSPGDIERDLGQRILGIVPHASQGSTRRDLATISMTDKFSMVAESFGGIRGVLDQTPQTKVVLVTSSTPGEGKTVSSCNLAIVSAKSGKNTLLVDLDMRRPQQRRVWGIPDTTFDILNALSQPSYFLFETLPIPTPVENLDVIVSHSARESSPAELLGSQTVINFILWAREHYDRIIIDSPPLGSASDAMVLGGLADGVILVTRFNKSKKGIARAGLRRLTDCGANVLGIIVNDVKQGNQKGYYGSFESYCHGYHYSPYGAAEDKKTQSPASKTSKS